MQIILNIAGLPSDPIAASAQFYMTWLPQLEDVLSGLHDVEDAVLLMMPCADHTHGEWRLAAVRMIARHAAPVRVNAVAIVDPCTAAARECADFLASACGITGQYLVTGTGFAAGSSAL